MPKKCNKKVGALAHLHRRKHPGLGLIVETTTTDDLIALTRERFKIRFKSLAKIKRRISWMELHEGVEDGIITNDQKDLIGALLMYGKENRNRRLAKIKWIRQPSAWEAKTTRETAGWYPFDMIRTVAPLNKRSKE